MTVYADILFLVNLYADFLLLALTDKCLRLGARNLRLFLAALSGAAFSLLFLLPIKNLFVYPLCLIFSFVMSFISFANKKTRFPLKAAFCLLMFSMFFGGITALLGRLLSTRRISAIGSIVYYDISPITLITLTAAAYFICTAAIRLLGRRRPDTEFMNIAIENGGSRAELLGIIDTGNELKEPFSGEPAIVAELESLRAVLPEDVLAYAEKRKSHGGRGFRLVPYSSLGGSGLLPAFKARSVCCKEDGRSLECWIAVSSTRLWDGAAGCIIPPTLSSCRKETET